MHRNEGERSSRNFSLYHDQEPQEYTRPPGVEEIQPHPQENDHPQRNQIILINHGKESNRYTEDG